MISDNFALKGVSDDFTWKKTHDQGSDFQSSRPQPLKILFLIIKNNSDIVGESMEKFVGKELD